MNAQLIGQAPRAKGARKLWILIAAYDVSTGESSEGHVAFNIIRDLSKSYRIVLVTRRNNMARLQTDSGFAAECRGVHLVGYDLPKWASWWKQGARFYQAYAYLWQMTWPLAVGRHARLCKTMHLIHVLNFHNDSIPSIAWRLGQPVIWGPINHNEIAASWRRAFWPKGVAVRHVATFAVRHVLWRFDPFLRLHIRKSRVILSAGEWVDRRLDLASTNKVIRRSQLGVSGDDFSIKLKSPTRTGVGTELVCAGRLDWIKGLDLAIEALFLLPKDYRLSIVGEGPAKKQLRALAALLGLETRVIFQPPLPRSELSTLYAHTDLFLFTSAEGAGLVWVEALASGLPVVAFDGMTEVAAAARYLPGIHLATGGDGRRARIESLATAITAAADMPHDPTTLRTAALDHYLWAGLSATIREAYRMAAKAPQ